MKSQAKETSAGPAQTGEILRFVRKTLGKSTQKAGKVFYSAPQTLFKARYILMGFNPGGDPRWIPDTIEASLKGWKRKKGNDYWEENWRGEKKNSLQKRVISLFNALGLRAPDAFTSNLNFVRSQSAGALKHDGEVVAACSMVWKRFLAHSPARRILCIGVGTAKDFLKLIEASDRRAERVPTSHSRASARLHYATINGKEYRIAALPHLSRFKVQEDKKLINAIQRHFKGLKT